MERGAYAQLAGISDAAAHQIDQALCDGQTKSSARSANTSGKRALFERFENGFADSRGDAVPTICHFEADHISHTEGEELDLSGLGEFRSIAHEVKENLFKTARIRYDMSWGFRVYGEACLDRFALR